MVRWYEGELAKPAQFPWAGTRYVPVRLGPSWATDGTHWHLPSLTLGWQVLGWCGTELKHGRDRPWRFTMEQARFLLWWYAVDDDGQFLFRDGVLQRLKGWGKDPVGACIDAVELLGPCRFVDFDAGNPVATDEPNAWVQNAATALEQTKNTMRLFPGLFTAAAKARYGLQIGKETIHAMNGERLLQAVTSSPSTLEGARSSFVLKNETQHWGRSNDGHEMAAVIDRNAAKSEGGSARTLAITNAYEPSEDSVAQRDREAWEQAEAGESLTTGILYDSLEAPPEAPLSAEAAPEVVAAIRGDSSWLDVNRIVQGILDTRNPPSRSRRFWYNQVVAAEDAWVVPQDFVRLADDNRPLTVGEEVVLFFDGSKSDDATGLVACRLSDGHVGTLGMWQAPPGDRGHGWTSPRRDVDRVVRQAFDLYRVAAFYADPSHTREDETQERYWDSLLDEWHRDFGGQLRLWATPGKQGHAVMWDMASPSRSEKFTAAAEQCAEDITDAALTHDGDPRLVIHVRNAKRYPNRWGVSLWKGHRESKRKVDLAVCMVGARMARRDVLNLKPERQRTGIVVAA